VNNADFLDHLVRAANYDPLQLLPKKPAPKRTSKNKGKKEEEEKEMFGDSFWEEQKDYSELGDLFPKIVNDSALQQVLKKMRNTSKMKKPAARTGKNVRAEIMQQELAAYEEPLQTWINKIRAAARKLKQKDEFESEVEEQVYDQHWVSIQNEEDNTFHSFRARNIFDQDAFNHLEAKELAFTAAHVHLPKKMGENEVADGAFETNVHRMISGFINATTKIGLTIKVRCCLFTKRCKLLF
jgi:hypothetical protein